MDMFDQFTDDLLIKILSFLPTQDAVAMSVLSKRWLYLWKLVPRLTFEDIWEDFEDRVYCKSVLPHYVSGTLLFHKSPIIETFHLSTASKCKASEIHLWVRIAVDRFVHDLKVSFEEKHGLIRLPSSLFRCETLETLELQRVVFLDVPFQFTFRSVKTLRLKSVKYADEESFLRLISSCPVLENLVVHSCSDDNVATFTVNVPSLRSLTVMNVLQDSGPNANLFVIQSHSLKLLKIVDEYGEVKVIGKLPELVEASLHTMVSAGNSLESVSCAKRLSLTLDGVARYPIVSILFQLVHLEFRGRDENWSNLLLHVLQYSPLLQILKLSVMDRLNQWNFEEDAKVCWIQPSCIPECLLFHLKTFEWRECIGSEEEIEVAIYILKNAKRLVTATICPESLRFGSGLRTFEKLEIATRDSRTCELILKQSSN